MFAYIIKRGRGYYIALTATARDVIWCRALLEEMGFFL